MIQFLLQYALFAPPGFALACLIRLLATLATNLDSKVGLNRRVARCIAEELGDLINGNDQYIMPVSQVSIQHYRKSPPAIRFAHILFDFSFERLSLLPQVDYV